MTEMNKSLLWYLIAGKFLIFQSFRQSEDWWIIFWKVSLQIKSLKHLTFKRLHNIPLCIVIYSYYSYYVNYI